MATHSATPSRLLPLLSGMTAGIFATLATQVLLNNKGMQIGAVWQNVANGEPINLRAALVWWVIAGSALVIGAIAAGVLAHFPTPWRRFRVLRWVLAAIAVFVLAHVAHGANAPEGIKFSTQLTATAAAILIAALMAAFGAVFALRR
jgi:hypothetical protein